MSVSVCWLRTGWLLNSIKHGPKFTRTPYDPVETRRWDRRAFAICLDRRKMRLVAGCCFPAFEVFLSLAKECIISSESRVKIKKISRFRDDSKILAHYSWYSRTHSRTRRHTTRAAAIRRNCPWFQSCCSSAASSSSLLRSRRAPRCSVFLKAATKRKKERKKRRKEVRRLAASADEATETSRANPSTTHHAPYSETRVLCPHDQRGFYGSFCRQSFLYCQFWLRP